MTLNTLLTCSQYGDLAINLFKMRGSWELTSSTRRWAKDRTVISTARADYRSDLASSLVVNFHDILNNVYIYEEAIEKSKSFFNSLIHFLLQTSLIL